MITFAFVTLGLTIFTLLIVIEEYRRHTAVLRRQIEESFGHAHRIYPPAPDHVVPEGKYLTARGR